MFWLNRTFLPVSGYSWEGLRLRLGDKEVSRSQQENETLVALQESFFQKLESGYCRGVGCGQVTIHCGRGTHWEAGAGAKLQHVHSSTCQPSVLGHRRKRSKVTRSLAGQGRERRQEMTSSGWGLAGKPDTGGAGADPGLRRAVSPGVSRWPH